ncbi:MAG: isopeptide-forming domain-containing fimbrial protein [Clostridia bacterium]|nr:isopeptide-forming domain-containing fimbrial protein [Clostridia bacterium]
MKKLVSFILTLSLTLTLISFSACEEVEYADATADANYTEADAITEVAYAFYRQGLQQNFNHTMSRQNINPTPEDATSQHMIFLDCASFVNAVYYETFGENVMYYDTEEMIPDSLNFWNYALENEYSAEVIGAWKNRDYKNEDARADLLNSIKEQLEPGDVINLRRGAAGQALLYVGNNTVLHATGNNFYESSRPEVTHEGQTTQELNGAVQIMTLDELFVKNSSTRYLFYFNITSFCVLRPMSRNLELTDNTKARMLAKGLDGEKTSNKGVNTALTKGEEVTYTLTLKNHRDLAYKNVEIKDVLDNNLTFVSGSDGVSCNGQTVTFTKEIKSGETLTVSWTAKVKDTTPSGTVIVSDKTTVNGVKQTTIKNSVSGYTASQLTSVANKAKEYASQGKVFENPIDMVESLYKDALNVELFDYENLSDVLSDIIDDEYYMLNDNSVADMVAPNLYGGQSVTKLYDTDVEIVRLITTQNLSVGDIIIAENDDFVGGQLYPDRVVYVYVGDMQVVACTTNGTTNKGKCLLVTMTNNQYEKEHVLVTIFSYKHYAVLRPSQIA